MSGPEWIVSGCGVYVETSPGVGGPCPQPPEGEQIGGFTMEEDAARAAACHNALRGVPSPEAAVEAARKALQRVEMHMPAKTLLEVEIMDQVRAALSLLRPGEDGDA